MGSEPSTRAEAEDSLLMWCSWWLAEGALSKGCRGSKAGTLYGHRGVLTHVTTSPYPLPRPAQGSPLWEASQVTETALRSY